MRICVVCAGSRTSATRGQQECEGERRSDMSFFDYTGEVLAGQGELWYCSAFDGRRSFVSPRSYVTPAAVGAYVVRVAVLGDF